MASSPSKPRPVQERFSNAVEVIRSLPKEGPFQTSNTVKLRFYALYKQANEGPCSIPKPSFWDATGRAKWEAWTVCGNMSKELAMQMYVEELQQLVETMPQTKEVEQFLKSIGPFYELAEETESDGPQTNGQLGGGGTEGEEKKKEPGSSGISGGKGSTSETNNDTGANDEEVESGGGETDAESDGSEDFQESLQILPESSFEEATSPPLSPVTQVSTVGQTRPTRSTTTSSTLHSSIAHSHTRIQSPAVRAVPTAQRERGGSSRSSSGAIQLNSNESFPIALEAINAQLSALQNSVQSMLQQLNTLAVAVHGVTQLYQQHTGVEVSQDAMTSTQSQPVPQLITRRGRLLTLVIRLAPLVVVWPFLVNFVMSFLTKRYRGAQLPHWIWGVLSILHTIFTIALMYYT